MHDLSLVPTHTPANLPDPLAAEEMWQVLGHSGSLAYEPWPEADESLLVQNTYNLPVQVGAGAAPSVGAVGGRLATARCGPCRSNVWHSPLQPTTSCHSTHTPHALSLLSLQVNGKMRGAIEVAVDLAQDGAVEAARSIPAVAKQLEGKDIKKVIFVPGEGHGQERGAEQEGHRQECCPAVRAFI